MWLCCFETDNSRLAACDKSDKAIYGPLCIKRSLDLKITQSILPLVRYSQKISKE